MRRLNNYDHYFKDLNEKINKMSDDTEAKKAFKQSIADLVTKLKKGSFNNPDCVIHNTVNATLALLDALDKASSDDDKINAFAHYLNACPHTKHPSSTLNKLIKTVVVSGVCALFAAALVTSVCLTLGVSLSLGLGAVAVAGAASLAGTGGLFFKKNTVEKSIENVVETGKAAIHSK